MKPLEEVGHAPVVMVRMGVVSEQDAVNVVYIRCRVCGHTSHVDGAYLAHGNFVCTGRNHSVVFVHIAPVPELTPVSEGVPAHKLYTLYQDLRARFGLKRDGRLTNGGDDSTRGTHDNDAGQT
jgi:hypothetical protein